MRNPLNKAAEEGPEKQGRKSLQRRTESPVDTIPSEVGNCQVDLANLEVSS